jgi:hypothetical protein
MFANIRSLFSPLAHAFQATAAALTQLSKTIAAFLDEHKEHFGATSADYLDHSLRISRFSPFLSLLHAFRQTVLKKAMRLAQVRSIGLPVLWSMINSHGF